MTSLEVHLLYISLSEHFSFQAIYIYSMVDLHAAIHYVPAILDLLTSPGFYKELEPMFFH
jgi:hypothetical protein